MTEPENEKTEVPGRVAENEAPDLAVEDAAAEDVAAKAEAAEAEEAAGEAVDAAEEPQADEAKATQADAAAGQADVTEAPQANAVAEEPAARDGAIEPKQKTGIGDLVAIGILSLIMVVLLCLPSFLGGSSSTSQGGYDLSGGTAATVNGVEIGENDVTRVIMQVRNSPELASDEDWGKWMASAGYTTESLRQDVANNLISRELLSQAAAEYGIEASDEEVDAEMGKIAESVGGEQRLTELLSQDGITLDEYRQSIVLSVKQRALADKVVTAAEPIDDQMLLEYLKMFYPDEVGQDVKSLDGIDEEKVDSVRTMLEQSQNEQAFSEWMNEYAGKADIQINPMPENLPYYVDVTKYQGAANDMDELAAGDYDEVGDVESPEEGDDVVEVVADDEQAKGEK